MKWFALFQLFPGFLLAIDLEMDFIFGLNRKMENENDCQYSFIFILDIGNFTKKGDNFYYESDTVET